MRSPLAHDKSFCFQLVWPLQGRVGKGSCTGRPQVDPSIKRPSAGVGVIGGYTYHKLQTAANLTWCNVLSSFTVCQCMDKPVSLLPVGEE